MCYLHSKHVKVTDAVLYAFWRDRYSHFFNLIRPQLLLLEEKSALDIFGAFFGLDQVKLPIFLTGRNCRNLRALNKPLDDLNLDPVSIYHPHVRTLTCTELLHYVLCYDLRFNDDLKTYVLTTVYVLRTASIRTAHCADLLRTFGLEGNSGCMLERLRSQGQLKRLEKEFKKLQRLQKLATKDS